VEIMHQLHSLLLPSQSGGAPARCASRFAIQYVTRYVILYGTRFGIARANLWNQRAKAWKLENSCVDL
jgi:hypothetical protein